MMSLERQASCALMNPTPALSMPIHFSLWHRADSHSGSTLPITNREQGRKVNKANIGAPVLLSLPRRFEIYAGDNTMTPAINRSGSLGTNSSRGTIRPCLPIRDKDSPYPLIRSYSLPTPSPSPVSDESDIALPPPAARANSHSPLHIDVRRPLSPIQEQSYVSPVSAFADSEISTLDLAGPVVKSPTKSQRIPTPLATEPPIIPPLNFAPYFPGPHPSQDIVGPPRRPPKAYTPPTRNSVHSAAGSSNGSLHADSFVTAKSVRFEPNGEEDYPEIEDLPDDVEARPATAGPASISNKTPFSPHLTASVVALQSQPLDRHGTFGSATSTTVGSSLRRKRQRFNFATPAFCMFWLGFLFPPCWWVGGWYFTFFAETPATRTLWEHYVRNTRWWAILTCGLGVSPWDRDHTVANAAALRPAKRLPRPKTLLLPRWVRNPTQLAALDGIAYYYPFVSRPPGYVSTGPTPKPFGLLHRYFDDVTRSKLQAVKVAQETPRMMIDPWIGRCRRALCYWILLVALVALGMMGWSFAVGAGKAKY